MSRTDIDSTNVANASTSGSYLATFVELILDGDATHTALNALDPNRLRLTDLYNDVDFTPSGDTTDRRFHAAGHLLGLGSLTNNLDVKQNDIEINLTGLDQAVIGYITQSNFIGSPVTIYRGYFDEASGAMFTDPYIVWRGIANDYATNYLGQLGMPNKVGISLNCRNLLVSLFDSTQGRFTSNKSFEQHTAGDKSMEFTATLTSFNPHFGKED